MNKEKQIQKYDKQVSAYENNLDNPTLAKWRRKIIPDAYGRVLEVGVGVGANFSHYHPEKVTEVVGVDFSSKMLKSASRVASYHKINADLLHQDINQVNFEIDSYDSIVSTLTLCSYPNPIETLNNLNDWCKEDGRVLLMEHGLSSNPLLSIAQKVVDPLFTKVSGCHCNRNMIKLIEESKLQMERVERYWSGIVCLIWAKPSK
jgi:ubiquinone/menaquinone biosynthesis C-methylase UbiE